jgi:hypothetical protein
MIDAADIADDAERYDNAYEFINCNIIINLF